jgi:hypothetical protein
MNNDPFNDTVCISMTQRVQLLGISVLHLNYNLWVFWNYSQEIGWHHD